MSGQRAGIVLAAGASSRMGQPKALLPWGDTTLLGYCLRQLQEAHADVVLVLGPSSQPILDSVRASELSVVYNLEVASGRSTSIRIGCGAVADECEAVLIQSVDQPSEPAVLAALFEAIEHGSADVAIPTFEGRRGHPVCFSGRLLPALRNVSEATQGLRAVVRAAAEEVEVPVASESVCWNLNDPAAYAAARAAAGRR